MKHGRNLDFLQILKGINCHIMFGLRIQQNETNKMYLDLHHSFICNDQQ